MSQTLKFDFSKVTANGEKTDKQFIRKVTVFISCLRSFKYKLCRKALETLYKSFILTQFDYANIAWDNCSGTLSNMLENLLWKL